MLLLSWNIQWGCGCDRRVNFSRISDAILQMGDFDVICLQEVAVNHPGLTGSVGEDQVAMLRGYFPGYSLHYGIGSDLLGDDGSRRLFGNLILSRLPVHQVFRHSLPQRAEKECSSMPRVALEAVIAIGQYAMRVTTVHLEYYSLAQRRAQIGRLREIHDEAFSHYNNVVVDNGLDPPFKVPHRPVLSVYCGDFNCEPDAEELRWFMQPFETGAPCLLDAWSVAYPGVPNAFTVGLDGCYWPDRAYCSDYFFVSEGLGSSVGRVLVNQETTASDHQPILLEIALGSWRE